MEQAFKAKLEKVQRIACLHGTGGYKSMMTSSMEKVLDITPIDLYIKEKAIKTYIRMTRDNTWETNENLDIVDNMNTHKNIVEALARKSGIDSSRHYNDMEFQTETILYKVDTDREKGKHYHTVTPDEEDTVNIFTDGSKLTDKRTGSGYIIKAKDKTLRHQDIYHLGYTPSVYQAELFAYVRQQNA